MQEHRLPEIEESPTRGRTSKLSLRKSGKDRQDKSNTPSEQNQTRSDTEVPGTAPFGVADKASSLGDHNTELVNASTLLYVQASITF